MFSFKFIGNKLGDFSGCCHGRKSIFINNVYIQRICLKIVRIKRTSRFLFQRRRR